MDSGGPAESRPAPQTSLQMHTRALLITASAFTCFLYLDAPSLATAGDLYSTQVSGNRPQIRHRFPLTKFYETPDPLPAERPGELIRKEEFEEYDVSPSVSATRILYHSRSADGKDVATSGVVLYPQGAAPPGGWSIIAWAHDLNGIARQCAPSLSRNLQHGPFLSMYVNLGYAVVATDYTGLGTTFRNAFADMQSNAMDVIYSMDAARSAVPQLGKRWIAVGTGFGSLAVAGVAEHEHDIRDPGYLGGILITGLIDLEEHYKAPDLSALLFLAYGVKTLYPQFDHKDILTERAAALLPSVEQTCDEQERKLDESQIAKRDWQNNQFVRQYFARNRFGQKPGYGPLLVITDADLRGRATHVIAGLCRQGGVVQWEKYDTSDPGGVIGESVSDQIHWIQGRFAARPAPNICSEFH